MSGTWVNLDALRFPRRHAMVRLDEADLFKADVSTDILFSAWSGARGDAAAMARLEDVVRRLATGVGAPADATIVAIAYRYATATVDVVLAHPSLEVVPDGCEAPVLAREASP